MDYLIQEEEQKVGEEKERLSLHEAATHVANGMDVAGAIRHVEQINYLRDEERARPEYGDVDETGFLDSDLEPPTANNNKQVSAIFHKLCEQEGISPKG